MVGGLGCGLASVSRAPVVLGMVMLLAWVLVSTGAFRAVRRSVGALALVAGLGIATGVFPALNRLEGNLLERHEVNEDTFKERAFGQFYEAYQVLAVAPWGAGLGSEQVAGNYYANG